MKIDFPPLDHKSDRWRPLQIHGWNLGHQILKNPNLAIRSKSLKLQKHRQLIADFLGSSSGFSARAFTRDFSPIYWWSTDISPIYQRFCRFFRRSIIGGDYRFAAAWYPIFLQNIGDISWFFNPCLNIQATKSSRTLIYSDNTKVWRSKVT